MVREAIVSKALDVFRSVPSLERGVDDVDEPWVVVHEHTVHVAGYDYFRFS